MYRDKTIAVVIPAFNEERLICRVLSSMPGFVDLMIVIDDASSDKTSEIVKDFTGRKIILIRHSHNQGVGGAIVSGYKKAILVNADITVVMAGDAQMDPLDLQYLLDPIIQGEADYVKGNRLANPNVFMIMPKIRLFGGLILTLLTKIVSGYWRISDSQCGYTAINRQALGSIQLNSLYRRYGFPNDILTKLNVLDFKVKDVSVKAIYGDEDSGINIFTFIPRVTVLLLKLFIWRIYKKYLAPAFFSYAIQLNN